jgi:biopolymer transport protein ExbB
MGLLGTVIGMIEMFTAQSAGTGGDPSALAAGIAVALYNTAFGLIVAIPALLFWRGLKSRVNHLQLELELESARFLRLAPDETLA